MAVVRCATLSCVIASIAVLAFITGSAAWERREQTLRERFSSAHQQSLKSLFDQLDRNHDGALQFEEFEDMTLSAWSAFIHLSVESMHHFARALPEKLVALGTAVPERSWWGLYWRALLGFQLCLMAYDHLSYALGLYKWGMPDKPLDVSDVQQATQQETLAYKTPWKASRYEMAKIAFMTLSGLAVFRFVWTWIFFMFTTLVLNVVVMSNNKRWRSFWYLVAEFGASCILAGCGFYKLRVRGNRASSTEAKLLLGNHVSVYESIALVSLAWPSFVSRAENLNLPFFHGVVMALDAVLIDRVSKESRDATQAAICDYANKNMGRQLLIFPEGTCGNQEVLFRFSKGGFATGSNPVQMIAVKFPHRHFNPCYTGVFVGGHEFWDMMWRSCCQFVQHLEIKFLPPVTPTDREIENPDEFAARMQFLIASHLHCKVSDFTFNLYRQAQSEYLAEVSKANAGSEEGRPKQA